jgi:transcriptional regulator with XRE-family HTH domain
MKPNLSRILKRLRKHNQSTQQDIADVLGISRQAYSRYESGIREPNMETLLKLAEHFNVSPQVFYIDDVDRLLDANMNPVELLARYQLKQLLDDDDTSNQDNALERYIKTSDQTIVRQRLSEHCGVGPTPEDVAPVAKSTSSIKRNILRYGFYAILILFTINIGFMTLHRLDTNYNYDLLPYSYINAVTPGQNVNQTMFLGIVRVEPFDPDSVNFGDQIVIYQDFGLNEYFVQEVRSVNTDNQTITTTYDQVTLVTNEFSDIPGVYVRDANLIGSIYYASKFNTGYVFLVLAHVILLAMYYLSFLNVNDTRPAKP